MMQRIPEPELMDSDEQTAAYAEADFADANALFTRHFLDDAGPLPRSGKLADLGCGPAEICIRLANALPGWKITGLDAGPNMLKHAKAAVETAGLSDSITLRHSYLPDSSLETGAYQAVVSNSLLHHLPDPDVLWASIRQIADSGAVVQVMDLIRPPTTTAAKEIITKYAHDAPEILREDFYNSLLAAYTEAEIMAQLQKAGLSELRFQRPSDRHWIVSGRLPA